MVVEITTLISIFNQLREWIGLIDARQVRDNANLKTALKSIYVAALETKMYLAAIEDRGEPQNHDTEAKLSRLWLEAALDLREIDPDLADRCLLKGDYWANPNRWTDEQVEESRINVNTVYEEARKLLIL